MKRIIEKTDDGSTTLFVPELNEHYHSTKGARTESQHIFINMGLKASTAHHPSHSGNRFRTGLNAWLTLEEAEKKREECILYRSGTLSPGMATRRATGVYFRQRTTNDRRQPVSGPRVIQTASYLPGKKTYRLPLTSPYEKYKKTLISLKQRQKGGKQT